MTLNRKRGAKTKSLKVLSRRKRRSGTLDVEICVILPKSRQRDTGNRPNPRSRLIKSLRSCSLSRSRPRPKTERILNIRAGRSPSSRPRLRKKLERKRNNKLRIKRRL